MTVSESITVLVTSVGGGVGQSIIKGLNLATENRDDVDYRVVGVDADPMGGGLYVVDEAYTVPYASEDGYIDRLIGIIDAEDVDLLIPGHDSELATVARGRERIESETDARVLISPVESVDIGLDKYRTFEFFSENGFKTPYTVLTDDIDRIIDRCGFPLVVKPRTGSASKGLFVPTDRDELDEALEQSEDEVIIQEYLVPDEWDDDELSKAELTRQIDEYSTEVIVADDGTVVNALTNWRKMVDGVPSVAKVADYDHIREVCMDVVEEMDAMGPINLQARVIDGEPAFFEINTRYSGSTAVRCAAGFNGPDAMARNLVRGDTLTASNLDFEELMEIRYKDEVYLDEEEYKKLVDEGTVSPSGYTREYF
jgi:carbamoyl-phosphate synthase large subunit